MYTMSGLGDNSMEPLSSENRKRKLSTCDTPGLGCVLGYRWWTVTQEDLICAPLNALL